MRENYVVYLNTILCDDWIKYTLFFNEKSYLSSPCIPLTHSESMCLYIVVYKITIISSLLKNPNKQFEKKSKNKLIHSLIATFVYEYIHRYTCAYCGSL